MRMEIDAMKTKLFWMVVGMVGAGDTFASPVNKVGSKDEEKKTHLSPSVSATQDSSLDFDFVVTGGYVELKSKFYGDQSLINPYSNLNHGLGINAFLPESVIPSPFGISLYLQGKYMTFSESVDKKLSSTKFVDLDYGIRGAIAVIDRFKVELDLGIAMNPMSIRRSNTDFKILNVPSTMIGTRFFYTFDLPSDWSLSLLGQQYLLGPSVTSGIKLKEGQGYGFGFQFNIDMYDLGYAYIGFAGNNEQQNSEQGSHQRAEDLISFGFSFSLDETSQDINPGM